MAHRAVVDGRRLRTILAGLGIAALTGLTSWAVASVSIWLVPVYLLLMVVTFAMPRAERAPSPTADSRARTSGEDADTSGQGAGEDRADGMGEPRLDAEPVPEPTAGESADAPTSLPDPAGPANAKPKRSRSRSRKAAKSAVEPVLEPGPVTWIRVGPGKFVRADSIIQDSPQVPADELAPAAVNPETDPTAPVANSSDVETAIHPETGGPESVMATDVHPVTDGLAPPIPAPEEVVPVAVVPTDAIDITTPAPEVAVDASTVVEAVEAVEPAPSQTVLFAVHEEPCQIDVPESNPTVEETVPTSVEEVSASVVEEYGIAPSAFDTETPEFPAAENLDLCVVEAPVLPQADPVCIADTDGPPPGRDARPGRLGSRRQRSWVRMAFHHMRAACVSEGRGSDPASSRRHVQARPRLRTALRCSSPSDSHLRQAARGASGRTHHLRRAFRPRSPPSRSA